MKSAEFHFIPTRIWKNSKDVLEIYGTRGFQNGLMTRDLLAVQMSVIRDRASLGLSLLGELAQPAFKPWDVEDFKGTLKIDYNYLKPYDVLMEDLHDVIF